MTLLLYAEKSYKSIFIQFFINIGVVIGLLPVTGVTLPFFSYGGSSLIMNFIMMGILVNISNDGDSQGQGNKWSIPTIILKGEWLEKLGFECGDEIEVICEKDIIKIYKSEKID